MSSSVFIESNIACNTTPATIGSESNLVVVYGKNGIQFDQRALENIIEEKTISTISVVRITSPTPSMKDEEEVDRLEELERQQECNSDKDESEGDTEDDEISNIDDNKSEKEHITGDDAEKSNDDIDENSTESEELPKVRKKPGRKPKIVKKQKKKRKPKERPEVVGLHVEQFYTDDVAREVVKSALKLAGIATYKRTAETDALLEIIKNDHNYTPFTSPEQMKSKMAADRLEVEKRLGQARKIGSFKVTGSKRKMQLQQQQGPQNVKEKQIEPPIYEPANISKRRENKMGLQEGNTRDKVNSEYPDDAVGQVAKQSDTNEECEYSDISIISNDSDNDRDSDFDFNVTNRSATAIRRPAKKFKRIQQIVKQPQPSQHSKNPIVKRPKEPISDALKSGSIKTVVTPQTVKIVPDNIWMTSSPNVSKKSNSIDPIETKATVNTTSSPITPMSLGRMKIVHVGSGPNPGSNSPVSNRSQALASPQNVKKIIINKNLSPKGVFTNLNTLIDEKNKSSSPILSPTLAKSMSIPDTEITLPTQTRSKGFVPIGVETASRTRLPAQISIHTIQSSSEIAAENDRKLDLIDSIVQDELQKPSLVDQEPVPRTPTKYIPELVKMLESTAENLDQQKLPTTQQTTEKLPTLEPFNTLNSVNAVNSGVGDIDITSTPLLNDITADFLQHVVGLIEDDKQFKEEVEKEVLGFEASNIIAQQSIPEDSNLNNLNSIFEPTMKSADPQPQLSAPIEKATTENILPSNPIASSTPARSVEPIQIVRGNGRVITLPPIEAPTTRAKRRAQVPTNTSTASADEFSSTYQNESSLDGSVYSNVSITGNDNLAVQSAKKSLDSTKSIKKNQAKNVSPNTPTTSKRVRRSVIAKRTPKASQAKPVDTEASESQEDDDDPNKLWCICRETHNNRFMICCDVCEDWFHGTCVNITKAMGLEMEQKGVDWTCPNCVKQQEEKKQPRITDMLSTKNSPSESQQRYQIIHRKNLSSLETTSAIQYEENKLIPKSEDTSKKSLVFPTENQQKIQSPAQKPNQSNTISPTINMQNKVSGPPSGAEKHFPRNQSKPPQKVLQQQKLKFSKIEAQTPSHPSTPCVFCKKPARGNAVYCSDDCIRKYAQIAIQNQNSFKSQDRRVNAGNTKPVLDQGNMKDKKKNLFEDMLRQADSVQQKIERINVFERSTGRIIFGHSAPTTINLKKWLQENPTFEVIQPGSEQAMEVEKRQNKRLAQTTLPTVMKFDSLSNKLSVTPTNKNISQNEILSTPQSARIKTENTGNVSAATATISKQSPKEVKVEAKSKEKSVKNTQSHDSIFSSQKPEPIRVNVRRTLKEQLLLRIKESQDGKNADTPNLQLGVEEVEQFVKSVESEMYHTFGRDTGAKYKAKYRSLMFNIKDRKNRTLFAKICAKEIEPKQLVKMTPEELASQELAKWRENENKHQLEMIKKSELDLLSCAKNYVLKTHKGEEVIVDKSTDCLNIDSTVPVEDVVTVLNNSKSTNGDQAEKSNKSQKSTDHVKKFDETNITSTSTEKLEKSKSKIDMKEKGHDRERDRNKKHKSHRDKDHSHRHDRTHSRKRSRTYSRSPSRGEKRHKSGSAHRDDRYRDNYKYKDRETDSGVREERKSRERERGTHKSDEREYSDKSITNDSNKDMKSSSRQEDRSAGTEKLTTTTGKHYANSKTTKERKEAPAGAKSAMESYNIVDKILQSVKTVEEAANLLHTEDENTTESNTQSKDPYSRYMEKVTSPPLWNGDINMADIASFKISIHSIVGNSHQVGRLMPRKLEVVGRIHKEMVWDYITKIKKSPTKEIAIVSIIPSAKTDFNGYNQLYEHLDSRNRLGVIGVENEHIRDFYIYPLNSNSSVPTILQSAERVDFYEDKERPDVFIGIIVLCITKRTSAAHASMHSSYSSAVKSSKYSHKSRDTPPGSPKRRRISDSHSSKDDEIDIDAIIKAPIVSKTHKLINIPSATVETPTKNDEDEPYSPVDSSDDSDQQSVLVGPNNPNDKEDLKRKVDEINKQIAAQRMEIAGLLNVKPTELEVAPTALANISLPSNLSKILASIKDKKPTGTKLQSSTLDDEYDPEQSIVSSSVYDHDKPREPPASSGSRLAQLSEAELLRMVPDDVVSSTATSSSDEPPPPGV